jgi:branched-chain amino acid transport system permease protein
MNPSNSLFVSLLVNGLVIGMLYGVVAMCFVLIYKASQVVNFAQGEMMLVGAWVCWWLLTKYQIPFFWSFLITLCFMMILGILLQIVVLRPMIGEPVISVIMVTIGLSIFLQALMKWMFGVFAQPFPPVFSVRTVNILGLQVEAVYVLSAAVCVLVTGLFAWFFKFSRMGLAMRATAFSQQVAQSLGIPVRQVFALSWGISAMVSAVAGIVIGVVNGVSSALSFYGIKVFPATIVGGLDSIVGGVFGGVIIGVVENVAHYIDTRYLHVGNMYEVAPFYVLILILLIRPYGLFGTRNIERV